MRKIILPLATILSVMLVNHCSAQGILNKVKDKAKEIGSKNENKKDQQSQDNNQSQNTNSANTKENSETKQGDGQTAATLKVYQNYDFVPGDKILFEDHFTDDQDGEFATHWELKAGQAVLNKNGNELAMNLTDGNYARVIPRMTNAKYLTDPFTIDFDWYHVPGAYGLNLLMGFDDKGDERESDISIQPGDVSFNGTASGVSLNKSLSEEMQNNFDNKWHHVAIAFKNHQLKVYIDQNRTLAVPDTKEDYQSVTFAGIGSEQSPIIFKNVRIASGGNMNMVGKKFTESKIVTHGINFDIDKALIRPESMGTLNMIVQVMKDNPDIKFEIDGHTDNSGSAPHNLALSQQRADAVKDQLVKMGIDASRLSTKGLGDSKPVSDNNSLEGKANNRRVEFVKM